MQSIESCGRQRVTWSSKALLSRGPSQCPCWAARCGGSCPGADAILRAWRTVGLVEALQNLDQPLDVDRLWQKSGCSRDVAGFRGRDHDDRNVRKPGIAPQLA